MPDNYPATPSFGFPFTAPPNLYADRPAPPTTHPRPSAQGQTLPQALQPSATYGSMQSAQNVYQNSHIPGLNMSNNQPQQSWPAHNSSLPRATHHRADLAQESQMPLMSPRGSPNATTTARYLLPANARDTVRSALLELIKHGVKFEEIAAEVGDEEGVRCLFKDLGLLSAEIQTSATKRASLQSSLATANVDGPTDVEITGKDATAPGEESTSTTGGAATVQPPPKASTPSPVAFTATVTLNSSKLPPKPPEKIAEPAPMPESARPIVETSSTVQSSTVPLPSTSKAVSTSIDSEMPSGRRLSATEERKDKIARLLAEKAAKQAALPARPTPATIVDGGQAKPAQDLASKSMASSVSESQSRPKSTVRPMSRTPSGTPQAQKHFSRFTAPEARRFIFSSSSVDVVYESRPSPGVRQAPPLSPTPSKSSTPETRTSVPPKSLAKSNINVDTMTTSIDPSATSRPMIIPGLYMTSATAPLETPLPANEKLLVEISSSPKTAVNGVLVPSPEGKISLPSSNTDMPVQDLRKKTPPLRPQFRKRPVAADFDDGPTNKKPFAHAGDDRLVIEFSEDEVSENEDDDRMEVDNSDISSLEQGGRTSHDFFASKPAESSRSSIRDLPPLSDFPRKAFVRNGVNSPASAITTPPIQANTARTKPQVHIEREVLYQRKADEIQALKDKIAAMEQKKNKTKSSGHATPNAPTTHDRTSPPTMTLNLRVVNNLDVESAALKEDEKQATKLKNAVRAEQLRRRRAEIESRLGNARVAAEEAERKAKEAENERKRWEAVHLESIVARKKLAEELEALGLPVNDTSIAELAIEKEMQHLETLESATSTEGGGKNAEPAGTTSSIDIVPAVDQTLSTRSSSTSVADFGPRLAVARTEASSDANFGPFLGNGTEEGEVGEKQTSEVPSTTPPPPIPPDLSSINPKVGGDQALAACMDDTYAPNQDPSAPDIPGSLGHRAVSPIVADANPSQVDIIEAPIQSAIIMGDSQEPEDSSTQVPAKATPAPPANAESELGRPLTLAASEQSSDDLRQSHVSPNQEHSNLTEYIPGQTMVTSQVPELVSISSQESAMVDSHHISREINTHHQNSLGGNVSIAQSSRPPNHSPYDRQVNLDMSYLNFDLNGAAVGDVFIPAHNLAEETFRPYSSPLKYLQAYRYHPDFLAEVPGGFSSLTYSNNINPALYLCHYEMSGGHCNDDQCPMQHIRQIAYSPASEDKFLVSLTRDIPGHSDEQKEAFKEGGASLIRDLWKKKEPYSVVAEQLTAYRRKFFDHSTQLLMSAV